MLKTHGYANAKISGGKPAVQTKTRTSRRYTMKTLAILVALSVLMLAGCGSNAPHGHSPVVIIGDSITARIPAGALPFALLNLGKGGDTSSQMLFRWIEV